MQWAQLDGKAAPARRRQGQPVHPESDVRPGRQARRARRVLPRPQPERRGPERAVRRTGADPTRRTATATRGWRSWTSRACRAPSCSPPSASAWSRRCCPTWTPRPRPSAPSTAGWTTTGDSPTRSGSSARPTSRCASPTTPSRELEWALERDARFIVMVPGPITTDVGMRAPGDPMFDDFWRAGQRLGHHRLLPLR